MYEFIVTSTSPFAFAIRRTLDGDTIFNTTGIPLIFEDQFLSWGTHLPQDPNIFGLGERIHNFRLNPRASTYTIFNADQGNQPDVNLYGSHPFYLEFRPKTGHSHGVFLLNSNAMDVVLDNNQLVYRTIGGVLDFFFFLGPDGESVVQQYQEVVGTPFLIPEWSLGFHNCRWGYRDLAILKQVVANYSAAQIPLEVVWMDIDIFAAPYEIFTTDPVRFPASELNAFVASLHSNDQKFVHIIDPGVAYANGTFWIYQEGLKRGAFITKPDGDDTPLQNTVWPGLAAFPDFSSSEGQAYWADLISTYHTLTVPVDGLWLDMNEQSVFSAQPECDNSTYFAQPPYRPGNVSNLDHHTLGLCGRASISTLYNYHNLYGFSESFTTATALSHVRQSRPFVLSRSTFAGHGRFAAHWLGDNESTYPSLASSIPSILAMNLFGVPMVGADIGGFNGDTTPELFARWIELGSFYMFSRDHNSIGQRPQEAYALGEQVAAISRAMLENRMSLLPFHYTNMFLAHVRGGTVTRPLFFEFPLDKSTPNLSWFDRQFLVGRGLLVSPVLEEGATTVSAYFPPDTWYDFWTGAVQHTDAQKGGWYTLNAPLETINVHVRSGLIVPRRSKPGMTVAATRTSPLDFLVAMAPFSGNATGDLVMDDGESLNTVSDGKFTQLGLQAIVETRSGLVHGTITTTILHEGYDISKQEIGSLTIYGSQCPPNPAKLQVVVNGADLTQWATVDAHGVLSVVSRSSRGTPIAPLRQPLAASYQCA